MNKKEAMELIDIAVAISARKIQYFESIKKTYLFSWDKIPGKYNERLIDVLAQNFGIDWETIPKIKKSASGRTIRITDGKIDIIIAINEEKTNVRLKIDDIRAEGIIARIENGKLNIYKKNKAYSYVENNQEIIKNTIANMDNNIFLTPAEMKSHTLESNPANIIFDDNKIGDAFKKELMKQSFGVYVQLF